MFHPLIAPFLSAHCLFPHRQVGVVYDILGSFGGCFLFYIYPAGCYLKLCADRGAGSNHARKLDEWWGFQALAVVMVVWGALIGVVGIYAIVRG
jgi:hypothetical protein